MKNKIHSKDPNLNHEESKPNEKRSRIFKKILDLGESSVIHGIPKIFKSNRVIIKLVWLLCLFVAISCCLYAMSSNINEYLSYDVSTNIKIITESKTEFPTVTVCNINPLTTTDGLELMQYIANKYFDPNSIKTAEQLTKNLEELNYGARLFAFQPEYSDEKRKNLGFNLSESLTFCIFNQEKCSIADFEWYYDMSHGNCFRFNYGNIGPKKVVIKPGVPSGLTMYFYLSPSVNYLSNVYNSGLRIYIHNKSIIPSLNEGVDIKKSEKTNIAISRTFISKYPSPFSECTDLSQINSYFYKLIVSANRSYTQQECFYLCYQKEVIRNCGCYDLEYPKIDESPYCIDVAKVNCTLRVYLRFKNRQIDGECLSQCPLECDSQKYHLSLSTSSFPDENFYHNFNRFLNISSYSEFKEKFLSVSIYYPDLSYTKISESPKISTSSLVSNIGGTMGLYVGISLLSLVEIIELVIEIFLILIKKN